MFILPLESFKDLNTSELYSVRKIRPNSMSKKYLHVVDQGISRLQVLSFAWAAQSRNKSDLKLPLTRIEVMERWWILLPGHQQTSCVTTFDCAWT